MEPRRKYELKRRAERQLETRHRITEAAVELHSTVGPARTTIAAIAERAGVQRHTVYAHFPTELQLFEACRAHEFTRDPLPHPAAWRRIADPETRLHAALDELYGYYARNEGQIANVLRDLDAVPVLRRLAGQELGAMRAMRDVLARGWGVRGRRRAALLAAIGHALDFESWRSLARRQGLEPAQAVELMVAFVRHASAHGILESEEGG